MNAPRRFKLQRIAPFFPDYPSLIPLIEPNETANAAQRCKMRTGAAGKGEMSHGLKRSGSESADSWHLQEPLPGTGGANRVRSRSLKALASTRRF